MWKSVFELFYLKIILTVRKMAFFILEYFFLVFVDFWLFKNFPSFLKIKFLKILTFFVKTTRIFSFSSHKISLHPSQFNVLISFFVFTKLVSFFPFFTKFTTLFKIWSFRNSLDKFHNFFTQHQIWSIFATKLFWWKLLSISRK